MAFISAAKPQFAKCINNKVEKANSYEPARAIGKLVKVEVKPHFKEGKLYADDGIAEEASVVDYADINLETSAIPILTACAMFGYSNAGTEDNMRTEDTDKTESNYGFFGYVYGERIDSEYFYTAVGMPRVKFNIPEDAHETQGENIVFNTAKITGRAYLNPDGKWRVKERRKTFEAALEEIKTMLSSFNTAGIEGGEDFPVDTEEPQDPETTETTEPETTT